MPEIIYCKPLRTKAKLALSLFLQGKTKKDICAELRILPQTLDRWSDHPMWKEELAKQRASFALTTEQIRERARRNLALKGEAAIETIDEIRKAGENERNRLSAGIFQVKAAGIAVREQQMMAPSIPVDAFVRVLEGLLKEPMRDPKLVAPAAGAGQVLEHRPA